MNIKLKQIVVVCTLLGLLSPYVLYAKTVEYPVVITGGFELNPVDNGRPVQLIGPALGVTPEIFRDAFSRVNPAKDGKPTKEREEANKRVLMDALSKHGITNDQLDTVSNYYRYMGKNGETWPHKQAKAFAKISGGKVVSIRITDKGFGYTSMPNIEIPGLKNNQQIFTPKITYGKNLKINGSLSVISFTKK